MCGAGWRNSVYQLNAEPKKLIGGNGNALKSWRSKVPVKGLKFKNNTDKDVEIFWVDFEEKPVRYGMIKAGE